MRNCANYSTVDLRGKIYSCKRQDLPWERPTESTQNAGLRRGRTPHGLDVLRVYEED